MLAQCMNPQGWGKLVNSALLFKAKVMLSLLFVSRITQNLLNLLQIWQNRGT